MYKFPSQIIPAETIDILRNYAAAAEASGQLHPAQLDIIYREKWFNLFVPEQYGGLQFSLINGLQIEEAIAWADGSSGWTVTLCSGANFFIGFLEKAVAKELFNDPKVCVAGSGHPSGIAKQSKNGFEISGRWKYATGAPHATIFTAVCKDTPGAFWFYREEVIIHEDWKTTGMIATASHTFEVKDLSVPPSRYFFIEPGSVKLSDPVYQYPFLQFAETTLAVNSSGMAIRFIELAEKIIKQKQTGKDLLIVQKEKLYKAREDFYTAVQQSWYELVISNSISQQLSVKVSTVSREFAAIARRAVDEIYPYCGLIAANPRSEINRVWRNLHTASQHSLLHT